jgi:hypothetical protein
MKVICDMRGFESEDEITDSGYIQQIESALRDRIGKIVSVEIRVKRKPQTAKQILRILGGKNG